MRLSQYDFPAPRYTSFPTAVQFHDAIDADIVKTRLQSLHADDVISLYTHIPFCHQLCHYCGCNTTITPTYDRVASYMDYLLAEIDIAARHIRDNIKVSRLHFGGGSPNYATTADLKRIIARYKELFDLTDAKIDMECDPRLLDSNRIKGLAEIGVTRVSLGVQDFDATVQKAINREQPYEMIAKVVDQLRCTGIEAINFDLMIGLPEQSIKTVDDTINQVLTLMPSRIAVFPYAHVPWMKKHQSLLEQFNMPDTPLRYDMTTHMHNRLAGAGYVPIGIDHYALVTDSLVAAQKQRAIHRNFQGYTDDTSDTILGFGLSSITQFTDAYAQSSTDMKKYRDRVEAGKLPIAKGLVLSRNDQARRALIEELMCYFKVTLANHPEVNLPKDALAPMVKDGLVKINAHALTVTDAGRPFTRVIAACFDPYFKPQSGRHAKAI